MSAWRLQTASHGSIHPCLQLWNAFVVAVHNCMLKQLSCIDPILEHFPCDEEVVDSIHFSRSLGSGRRSLAKSASAIVLLPYSCGPAVWSIHALHLRAGCMLRSPPCVHAHGSLLARFLSHRTACQWSVGMCDHPRQHFTDMLSGVTNSVQGGCHGHAYGEAI